MDSKFEHRAQLLHEFVRNIGRLYAHGDRLKDGSEILWDANYAAAQLWEIIDNARTLYPGSMPENVSAFYTPRDRPNGHAACVKTTPKIF